MIHKILIKPLSINEAYKGRRFRTPKYDYYKRDLRLLLPDNFKVPQPPFKLSLEFGTCAMQDIDNNCKPFIDCLCDKYGFDDRYIYELNIKKVAVKKTHEYIIFNLESLK